MKEWEKKMHKQWRKMEREADKNVKRRFGTWNHNHKYSKIKQ